VVCLLKLRIGFDNVSFLILDGIEMSPIKIIITAIVNFIYFFKKITVLGP